MPDEQAATAAVGVDEICGEARGREPLRPGDVRHGRAAWVREQAREVVADGGFLHEDLRVPPRYLERRQADADQSAQRSVVASVGGTAAMRLAREVGRRWLLARREADRV